MYTKQPVFINYVRSCHVCQLVKHSNTATLGLMQPIEVPETPNGIWSIDTVVLGNAAKGAAAKYAQCIVDHHSRFCWTFPTRTNTTEIVISCLTTLFTCVGKPRILISDNGTNFVSRKMTTFLTSNKIEHRRTSTYHPQSNGLNERTHFTVIRGISLKLATSSSRLKWSTLAKLATAEYNENPHGVTGFPPVFLQFGTRPTHAPFTEVNLEDARKLAVERTRHQQVLRKSKHDAKHSPSSFKVGDKVLHRVPSSHPDKNKLSPVFDGPYTVVSKNGSESYTISRTNDQSRPEIRAHASSLKKYYERPPQFKETADQTQKERSKATTPSFCCYFVRFENAVTSCFLNIDDKHVLNKTNSRYLSYGRSLLEGSMRSNRLLFR